jgi:hypothetical protein
MVSIFQSCCGVQLAASSTVGTSLRVSLLEKRLNVTVPGHYICELQKSVILAVAAWKLTLIRMADL